MYRYPFTPYPNSWYRVAYSEDLEKGELKRLNYLGEDLVLFRGEDGKANVIDAYCPHLGADLSAGGKVKGNTIACPFHDWRFDGNGDCVEIPYCGDIPKKAKTRSWPVCEKSGIIFMFYHAEGLAPDFEIPDGPFDEDQKWNKPIEVNWKIRMHIQEVAENAVDTSHFPMVHAYADLPEIKNLEFNGRSFTVDLLSQREGMNFVGPAPAQITYHGFGVVHARLKTIIFNRFPLYVNVLLTSTPVDMEHVEISIMSRLRKTGFPLLDLILRPFMRHEIVNDFKNDIPIWEAKVYKKNPIMCKDDGPIGKVRKWAKQFYSDVEFNADVIATDKVQREAA